MARNPRINASLHPDVYNVVVNISNLTGLSHSKVVSDLLEQTLPVLQTIYSNLEKLQAQKNELDQGLKNQLLERLERTAKRSEKQLKKDLKEFENVISIR